MEEAERGLTLMFSSTEGEQSEQDTLPHCLIRKSGHKYEVSPLPPLISSIHLCTQLIFDFCKPSTSNFTSLYFCLEKITISTKNKDSYQNQQVKYKTRLN